MVTLDELRRDPDAEKAAGTVAGSGDGPAGVKDDTEESTKTKPAGKGEAAAAEEKDGEE